MADPCYSPSGNKRTSISNTGKPARTSLSILKPLKARCPLQDLDLVPNTEDDTTTTTSTFTAMRRRRVSFAGVNKVKEFHTAAESLTVHHTPAYDEPFTTTMSSDSSSHHHLTDSKISDGTGLEHMSQTSCIDTNFANGMDAVLDLTVKSLDNSSYKPHGGIDFESKENLTNNFLRQSQNTYYEADMECTTPHITNHLYYDSKNLSFANKSMELTSMISGFPDRMQSNKSSMMEFTEVIHGPSSFLHNESRSKQYESMEFTQQVEAGIVMGTDFDDSFPSTNLQPNLEFYHSGQNESQSDLGMEFTEPLPKVNIFNGQNLNGSTSEPVLSDLNPSGQVNTIFSSQTNVANNDFDDSNEMSFGMTGVVSQPFIECFQNGENHELEITNNASRIVTSFSESVGQNIEIERSNAEGSEMSITEANVFANPEHVIHVPTNLEAGKKSVFENAKAKQSDHVLSFLRSYSGTEKNAPPLPTSLNLSLECTEAIKRSVEKQTAKNSSNDQLTNSHISDLSVSKSHSMEFTNALSNVIKSNSSIGETSVAKPCIMEVGSCVNEMSISKNSSMEFTKAVSNNLRFGDTNSNLGDLSVSKNNSMEFTKAVSNNFEFYDTNSHFDNLSVSKNSSMEFTKAVSNNMRFDGTNSPLGEVSASKSHTMEFTNALSHVIKSNCSVGELSVSKPTKEIADSVEKSVSGISVSKNSSMEFTKAASNNIRFGDSIPSLTEDLSKLVNVSSEDIFSKTAETNSIESFCEKGDSVFETEKAINSHLKDNQRITDNFHNPENLLEDKCVAALDTIDFNATNVVTSTQEPKSSKNVPFSENVEEKLPAVHDTIDFTATDVITSTQEPKSSQIVPITTNGRKSMSVEAFLSIDVPVKRKVGANFDFVNQEILAQEMELTKDLSNCIQSSNSNVSNNLSQRNEKQCSKNEPDSFQDFPGSQPMEFTNLHSHDEKANEDDNFENADSFSGTTLQVENVKDKRKSRRSELFVPLQKPLLFGNKMNIIEESEIGNDSGSLNSVNNMCSENSSQAFASEVENDNDNDKMRCQGLSTRKPANSFTSIMAKSKVNKSELSIDCAYKLNDSQMFTKSMLEQTAHDGSSVSEPVKSNNAESVAANGKTGSSLLASVKSFHTDEVSLSCEFSASLNFSEKKEILISESINTKSVTFHHNDLTESIMNEDTQTFSHFMKAPFESSKNSTLIKPMMNSTIMANILEESQFTLPIENIPRSVFLKDDIDCPSFSDKSGLTLSKVIHEISEKQNENTESLSKTRTSDYHQSFAKNEQSQEVPDDKKLMEEVNEVLLEKKIATSNDDEFGSIFENQCAEENNSGSPDLCNVSFPEAEFTINEEMLKNITIDRSKSRKSIRKSRCLADLNDSITLQHDESVKKIKILNESCNLTGIAKLPDLTASSAGVSPPSDKSALLADESKMDVSITVEIQSSNDQNHTCTLNFDDNGPKKLQDDNNAVQTANTIHEEVANINTSSLKIPEITVSDQSEQPKSSDNMIKQLADLRLEQNPKTPRSCLKKVQNFGSVAKSTTVTHSALKQANVNSETKNVYFQESGPRKRGFVKKAANLYESFVANTSPASEQKKSESLSACKRVLDENYPKEKQTHLKVYQFLETVTPNANTSTVTDIETALDVTTVNQVVRDVSHNELSTFSPENHFEKSSYVPSASSNTSMIVHDDHDSNISPAFKTPRSMAKNKHLSSAESPKTPSGSPAPKKQKLPFGSTPVRDFNKGRKPEMQAPDCDSEQASSSRNNSSNSESFSETPSCKKLCPVFLERFEAETRATKKEWNALEANSSVWSFEFLDGHLRLVIHLKPASSSAPVSVSSITFSPVNSDDGPIQVIGQNILLEKYPAARLKSLCKNTSNVFDVLHMIGNDAIFARKVMHSLKRMYQAVFTNNSVVIELTSLRPNHLAEVTVDLSSWKSLSSSSVKLDNWIGNIRLPKIRSLFEECEKNHDCVRQFYNKCLDYIDSIDLTEPAS